MLRNNADARQCSYLELELPVGGDGGGGGTLDLAWLKLSEISRNGPLEFELRSEAGDDLVFVTRPWMWLLTCEKQDGL